MASGLVGFSKEWLKIKQYCDRAEHCHLDVKKKLYQWDLPTEIVQQMLALLIEENLLNEERYAKAYANDHYRFKNWGKRKIKQGLALKGVSETLIELAISQIPDEEEFEILQQLANQKWKILKDPPLKRKFKVMRFLFGKGFDSALITKVMDQLAGDLDE
jgi:regulatory protein